ncbi:receiver/sensor box histidine kinase (plasmid) [Halobacterium salinarum R1]|nr:PAS domain S-box protein [Halobacterium salinarum]CAP15047.1 receiver/sensor box histidine kinase [Halobacterium salinarum R1]DAC79502.1 TPA_inf: receiver/sensor box histidine kinase [Halobacterium salinarum NRC-1]DAC79705.1 TPA_inf: receiver/sensor box histidine kinase [Halobacterium salinarum NRC-1]
MARTRNPGRGGGGSIQVLHVDDEPDFADMAAEFLEREDDRLTVESATSASEGLDRLDEHDYDCIVSDYDMPGMDGVEFLETVRKAYPNLPFILFTGKGSEQVASEAIAAGVNDYLQKGSGSEVYELLGNRITNHVERVRAQRKQQRHLDAIETAQEGISILDEDEHFRYVNQSFADLYGYEPAEMIGEHWELIYPDEEVQAINEEVLSIVEETGYWRGETTGLRADDSTFIEAHTLSQTDEGGLICTARDITEAQEQAQELEEVTQQYRTVVEQSRAGIRIVQDGTVKFVNDRLAEMLGYPKHELLGAPAEEIITSETEDIVRRHHATRMQGEPAPDRYEVEVDTEAGDRLCVELSVARIQYAGKPASLSLIRDITERKEGEQALERYAALFDNAPDATALVEYRDETPIIRDANPAFEALFAGGDGDIVGQDIDGVVASSDQVAEARTISQQVQEGEPIQKELTRETADGLRTFDFRSVPVEDRETGEIESAFVIYPDITERKAHRRELERYETLVEATADPMYMLDEEGRFTYVDDAMVETTGYSEETLLGEHVSKVMEEDHVERGEQLIESLLSSGEKRGTFEMVIETAGGERFSTENHISLLDGDGEFHGTAGVLRDITDRLERERQLKRERDRLDEFASVVSHDLRNPLNVAEGRLELAMENCESEHHDSVAQSLDRMESLIDDVLSLARAGEAVGETEPVELADLVEACWQTVETASAGLVVETETTIQADPSRLQQLFENLLRNAVEHGGEDVTITIGDLPDGFYVEDDGQGIPEDERGNVLDAGYSTAADGTGLGLSIVREVAEAHGWEIEVTESSDGGARFEIIGVQMEG